MSRLTEQHQPTAHHILNRTAAMRKIANAHISEFSFLRINKMQITQRCPHAILLASLHSNGCTALIQIHIHSCLYNVQLSCCDRLYVENGIKRISPENRRRERKLK